MANTQNFEQLLEYIVNGEQEKAEELFHALVVNKSREIYEGLFEEEMKDVDIDEAKCDDDDDEDMEEAKSEDEDDETVEEAFIAFSEEPGGFGGDPTDDMMGDVGADDGDDMDDMGDMGGDDMDDAEMGGEGELEDRVMDLEDALDDLKAEFEKLMADEENEPEHNDGVDDPDFGGDEEESDEEESDMDDEEEKDESFNFEDIEEIDLSPVEQMREYVEKVGETYKGGKVASSSEAAGANTKSVVAGKNDMGGTTANIVKGGTGDTKGTKGGLLDPSTKEDNAGNVNVPGGKAGVKHLKNVPAGHGAEKKGKADGVSVKPFLKPQVG